MDNFLYAKLIFCFLQIPKNIGKIYVQNISQKKRILQSFTLLIESNNLSVFVTNINIKSFTIIFIIYHLSTLKEHWHKIKWTKQSNKNNTVIEKFNAKRIVSIINVYDKYDNLKFHFLFYPKKLNTNDNKNIMHSYHVSKN